MDDVQESRSLASRRADVATGLLLTGAALAIGVAGITWMAQRTHRFWLASEDISSFEMYSLPLHTASMTGIGLIAVMVASVLVVRGRAAMAAPTLIGAAIGPMALVAVPVSEQLALGNGVDTVFWWRALVAGIVLAILGTGTWWATRHLDSIGVLADPDPPECRRPLMSGTALYILATGVSLAAQVPMMMNANAPQPMGMLGWALLVGGCAVAGTALTARQVAVATMGCGAVLLLMATAYLRDGGWPGVAGWELHAQSPIILTWVAALAFAASPFAGFLTFLVRLPAVHSSLEPARTDG
ncbi:hypothetical protein LWF15_23910 [Kineosporia rhizophila]|uniref:hypothetical protein n=1 Tax=Kineosporia rhizophila TaxID=84633 RepID=UPI001E470C03|nr:hypothetical protein [Kineosporia rhizophila]MCE0538549.1 hypothetical protein [Kineosporia rhizophila]